MGCGVGDAASLHVVGYSRVGAVVSSGIGHRTPCLVSAARDAPPPSPGAARAGAFAFGRRGSAPAAEARRMERRRTARLADRRTHRRASAGRAGPRRSGAPQRGATERTERSGREHNELRRKTPRAERRGGAAHEDEGRTSEHGHQREPWGGGFSASGPRRARTASDARSERTERPPKRAQPAAKNRARGPPTGREERAVGASDFLRGAKRLEAAKRGPRAGRRPAGRAHAGAGKDRRTRETGASSGGRERREFSASDTAAMLGDGIAECAAPLLSAASSVSVSLPRGSSRRCGTGTSRSAAAMVV